MRVFSYHLELRDENPCNWQHCSDASAPAAGWGEKSLSSARAALPDLLPAAVQGRGCGSDHVL